MQSCGCSEPLPRVRVASSVSGLPGEASRGKQCFFPSTEHPLQSWCPGRGAEALLSGSALYGDDTCREESAWAFARDWRERASGVHLRSDPCPDPHERRDLG